jgi:hypothetical protein
VNVARRLFFAVAGKCSDRHKTSKLPARSAPISPERRKMADADIQRTIEIENDNNDKES